MLSLIHLQLLQHNAHFLLARLSLVTTKNAYKTALLSSWVLKRGEEERVERLVTTIGVICDRRKLQEWKERFTIWYWDLLWCVVWHLQQRQEAELKMLRFLLGLTGMEKKWGTAEVEWFRDNVREARFRQLGHVQRKYSGYTGHRMLNMELPGRRTRERPQKRQKRMLEIEWDESRQSAVASPKGTRR